MGLFARLFKKKPDQTGRQADEKKTEPEQRAAFLRPRDFPAPVVRPKPRPEREPRGEAAPEASSAGVIVVTVGDVLARIPPHLLQESVPDLRRELRFAPEAYLAEISRGRVTVALSNIAAQGPELFRLPITEEDDCEIRLPFQKVLDQIIQPGTHAPARVREVAAPPPPDPVTVVSAEPGAAPADAEPAREIDAGGATIRLSLAAIVAGCPEEVFPAGRLRVDDRVSVELPFAPIERQLADGQVEISAPRFRALLPAPYAEAFRGDEGLRIPLPLEEIFRNLPGGARLAPAPGLAASVSPPPDAPRPASREEARPQFMFFSPAPPAPRQIAPPAVVAAETDVVAASAQPGPVPLPIAPDTGPAGLEAGAEVPWRHVVRPAHPAGAPPLRSLEIRPATDGPTEVEPGPRVLQSTTPAPVPSVRVEAAVASVPPLPVARPLMVPPPSLPGVAQPPVEGSTPASETTADQSAVLEFLSGATDFAAAPESPRGS